MPWGVVKMKNGYFVVNKDTGRKMNEKPHKSQSEALNHLRAIYANAKK